MAGGHPPPPPPPFHKDPSAFQFECVLAQPRTGPPRRGDVGARKGTGGAGSKFGGTPGGNQTEQF